MIHKKIIYLVRKIKLRKIKFRSRSEFFIEKNYSIIGEECISIGDKFYASNNLKLQAWKTYKNQKFEPLIEIGSNVSMMENCQISCCKMIIIGDGCLFGPNVFITDNYHGNNTEAQVDIIPIERPLYVKGEVVIGDNVWIGRNVCIMPGVTIGNGVVIGANAVVTHDIPEKSVAVGIPAKVIKKIS